ncbi:MAG: thioredoxin domain-containing protein, partial [Gammaproteobacteria bacterium]|nr:thioredoxin domain-containing protein [Gammaproteobacteria bacterium]
MVSLGGEAIEKARNEKTPILLSIGYSACHWCHVMAHESFEDDDTAQMMNRLFVNIKVDREERPDLDKIYQTAHHLLTQRTGGWPLTMFLMPDDHVPFFGGTYFPSEARHGMPSFRELMLHIHDYYQKQMDDLIKQNESVMATLQRYEEKAVSGSQLTAAPLDIARQQLVKSYDRHYGGFGAAPKFPHPTNIQRILRHWAVKDADGEQDDEAYDIFSQTLHAMASGGIYDQLAGGFCRYSVDERWEIPHFEKMLYDNGPLLSLYAQAYKATDSAVFKRIVKETGEWVIREMQSTDGGYYSTLDADSEGEEGKFFAWSREEVKKVLTDDIEFRVIEKYFGLDAAANFEGKWHFNIKQNASEIARSVGIEETEVVNILFSTKKSAKEKLFVAREQRVKPGRDEKILTSWNGLMIKGMAEAGRLLGEEKFIDSARRALDFVKSSMWIDGRLLATSKDGTAHLNAYLDDYVFLIDGIVELLQARWNKSDLDFAIQLLDVVLAKFEDKEKGGFFFTASDHE